MNNIFILFFALFFSANLTLQSQSCQGKHSNAMTLALTHQGIEFYYKINHCSNGDEILIQVSNTNTFAVNFTFEEKAFSANQVKQSGGAKTLSIAAQSIAGYSSSCNLAATLFSIPGWLVFPEEFHPENNYYPEILSYEVFNVNIQ